MKKTVRPKMSREQRQELVAKLRRRGMSLRRIAELLGVTYETARQDLSIVKNLTIENPPVVQRADGKTYPARQRTEAERLELVERAQRMRAKSVTVECSAVRCSDRSASAACG